MTKEEQAFRKCELFSKEEIITSIEMTMDTYRNDKELRYTDLMLEKVIEVWSVFLDKIKKAKLPVLTELWKYYVYEYVGDSLVLNLCEGSDVEVDEDGLISSISVIIDRPIITVDCPYMTLDEYAAIQKVKPATVAQWIKRGKLKYAKFENGEWHIPSLEERPYRGFDATQYTLISDQPYESEEYPLVCLSNSISIFLDDKTKEYTCHFDNYKTDFHERMDMSKEEIESLEYAIIKSGKFYPGPRGGFVPLLPKAHENE